VTQSRYGYFAAISVLATALNLLTTFLNIPILVRYLGVNDYGYWILFTSIGLIVTIIGTGMPQATLKFVSVNEEKDIPLTFRPIMTITLIQAFALPLVIFFCRHLVFGLIHAPVGSNINVLVLAILTISWSISIPLNVGYSLQFALRKHISAYGLQSVIYLLTLVLNWIMLSLGYGLIGLSLIQLIVNMMAMVVVAIFLRKELSVFWVATRKERLTPGTTTSVLKYGIYQMIGQLAFGLIFNLDNVFANRFSGINDMVYYNFRLKIFQVLTTMTLKPFWNYIPLVSSKFEHAELLDIKRLLLKVFRISLGIVTVIAVFYVFDIEHFIHIWTQVNIPRNLILDISFGILLVVEQFLGNLAIVVTGMDLKSNRYLTTLSVLESGSNVLLTLYLGAHLGVIGIVWGTIIPRLLFTSLLILVYLPKVLSKR